MPRKGDKHPLPAGLRICRTCHEARGTDQDGDVSACFCSGLICNACGARARRPITDYYDWRDGTWTHVPYFGLMAHRCRLKPGEEPNGSGWTRLEPAPEVLAYQEGVTRLALAALEPGDEIEMVAGDRSIGNSRLGPEH
jgi:hypothetical protein